MFSSDLEDGAIKVAYGAIKTVNGAIKVTYSAIKAAYRAIFWYVCSIIQQVRVINCSIAKMVIIDDR